MKFYKGTSINDVTLLVEVGVNDKSIQPFNDAERGDKNIKIPYYERRFL